MGFCTGCGTSLAPSAKFCTSCGKPAAGGATAAPKPSGPPRCSKCSTVFTGTVPKFCVQCGTPTGSSGGGSSGGGGSSSATTSSAASRFGGGGSSSTSSSTASRFGGGNSSGGAGGGSTSSAAGSRFGSRIGGGATSTSTSGGGGGRFGGGGASSSASSSASRPPVGGSSSSTSGSGSGGVGGGVVSESTGGIANASVFGATVKAGSRPAPRPSRPSPGSAPARRAAPPPASSTPPRPVNAGASSSASSGGSSSVPEWASLAAKKTGSATQALCPSCGTHNGGAKKFCVKCGENLQGDKGSSSAPRASRAIASDGRYAQAKTCEGCGKKMGSKFCTSCGRPASGASAPASRGGTAPPAPSTSSPAKRPTFSSSVGVPSTSTSSSSSSSSSSGGSSSASASVSSSSASSASMTRRCPQCSSMSLTTAKCLLCSYVPGQPVAAAKPTCGGCGARKSAFFCPHCGHKDSDDVAGGGQPVMAQLERMRAETRRQLPIQQRPAAATSSSAATRPPPPSNPPPPRPTAATTSTPPATHTAAAAGTSSGAGEPSTSSSSSSGGGGNSKAEKKSRGGTLRSWKTRQVASLKKPLDMKSLRSQYGTESTTTASADNDGSGGSDDGQPRERRRTWKQRYDSIKTDEFAAAKAAHEAEEANGGGGGGVGGGSGDASSGSGVGAPVPVGGMGPPKRYMDPSLPPREKVVAEIIETEEDYLADLGVIVDVFLQPCREQKGVKMTPEDVTAIFSNVELIRGVNETLNEKLKVCDPKTGAGIGEAFVSMGPYLRMYASYCSNQSNMLATIDRLKADNKRSKMESFLQYCLARPECRNLDFSSFMIKPMQRVTKYPLLLRELIKLTDADHPEYESLLAADKVIQEIVTDVNDKKRTLESGQKLMELSSALRGSVPPSHPLVTPTRRLEREQELAHFCSRGKHKPGYLFLFNDLLVYTKKLSGGRHMLKAFAPLEGASVNAAPQYASHPSFELHCPAFCSKPWPLAAKSEAERALLMEAIHNCIEATQALSQGRKSTQLNRHGSTVGAFDMRTSADAGNNSAAAAAAAAGMSQHQQQQQQSQHYQEEASEALGEDIISFTCTYSDERVLDVPRSVALDSAALTAQVSQAFGLDDCTLFYEDNYLDDEGLAYVLSAGATAVNISVYDPY